jgi:hypothetical protein
MLRTTAEPWVTVGQKPDDRADGDMHAHDRKGGSVAYGLDFE